MRLLSIIFIIIFLYTPIVFAEEVNGVGDYSLSVKSVKSMFSQHEMIIDIDLVLNLNKGNGFAYIPLPIKNSNDFRMIIEQTSENKLVLFGFLRPTEEFSLCQVKLIEEKASNLRILFKNVTVPIHPSGRSENDVAINLLFEESYKKILQAKIPLEAIPRLTNIFIEFNNFQDSAPISNATSSYSRRVISRNLALSIPENVIIYLSIKQNETFLYWILGIMGILLGYFVPQNILSTPRKAKFSLIIGILTSFGAVAFFFGYLTVQQRINDTTTIVTFGSVFGILIGLIISAIQLLFQSRSNESPQGSPDRKSAD